MTMKWTEWLVCFYRVTQIGWLFFLSQALITGLLTFLSQGKWSVYLYGLQLTLFFIVVFGSLKTMSYVRQVKQVTDQRLETFTYSDPLTETVRKLAVDAQHKQRAAAQHVSEQQEEQLAYFTLWLHQIKTPVAALDLLNQASEHQEKQLVAQELLRIEEYTTMALNYLKLTDPTTDLDIRQVDLDAVVRKAVKKYSLLFIHKQIRLDYEPISFHVTTDEKWLTVLIEQLISNALKYTRSGSIRIAFDRATHELSIQDTGIGIQPDDLPRIFSRGYSGHNGRLHEKSTGLGLFLGKRIADRLGHALLAESEVGVGTIMKIRIPESLVEMDF